MENLLNEQTLNELNNLKQELSNFEQHTISLEEFSSWFEDTKSINP